MTDKEIIKQILLDVLDLEDWQLERIPDWLHDTAEKLYWAGWRKREND